MPQVRPQEEKKKKDRSGLSSAAVGVLPRNLVTLTQKWSGWKGPSGLVERGDLGVRAVSGSGKGVTPEGQDLLVMSRVEEEVLEKWMEVLLLLML